MGGKKKQSCTQSKQQKQHYIRRGKKNRLVEIQLATIKHAIYSFKK